MFVNDSTCEIIDLISPGAVFVKNSTGSLVIAWRVNERVELASFEAPSNALFPDEVYAP